MGGCMMPNAKDIDVSKVKLKVLCWGPSGSGKTTFAGTFPRPYIFDFDGGIVTLRGKDVQYDRYNPRDPETWRKVDLKLKTFERGEVKDIDTIVIDSLTSLQEAAENQAQMVNGRVGEPTSQHEWGLVINYLGDLMYRLVALADLKGFHLVVVAHEQIEKDELQGKVLALPLVVGKKLPGRLPVWFDEVYYAYTEKGKDGLPVFKLQLVPDAMHFAKSRLRSTTERPDFGAIYRKIVEAPINATQSTDAASTTPAATAK